MIYVAIADDHGIARSGIKTIIECNGEISVVLEASNGKELVDKICSASSLPDVVVLDINMPVMNGFDAIRTLQQQFPSIKIIILSLITEEDTVLHMINSGASGYLPKNADPVKIAEAIIKVYNQGFYLGALVKKDFFSKTPKNIKPGFYGKQYLTPKEVEFIRFASSNLNYKEIADKMGISIKTLENYRDNIFQKLDIKNRAALALYGVMNGLVSSIS